MAWLWQPYVSLLGDIIFLQEEMISIKVRERISKIINDILFDCNKKMSKTLLPITFLKKKLLLKNLICFGPRNI